MKPARYLSVKEAAAILGLSDKTMYKLIKQGYIKGVVILGSIHRINEDVFLTDLEARASRSTKKISESGDKHHLLR